MTRPGPIDAYVLHQWDWSETSLIVDLFTRESGRVAVAAKGAKRPTSHLRAVLLPFQRVTVSIARPRADEAAEIFNLRTAEYAGGGAIVPAARLMAAFYLNELVLRLLARQDPHPRLYDAYADSVQTLASDAAADGTLRAFELMLLRETGVLPDLGRSGVSQLPVLAERAYALRPELGLIAAAGDEAAIGGEICLALQATLDHGALPELRSVCAAAPVALERQLRGLLDYHLGSAMRCRDTVSALRRLFEDAVRSPKP